ncbi:recombination regulator RecX [Photobacterium sp.]|uniref:recombination regulator RecX n=1 Tax=Photobacterium sp. TaxID=660 RepID=UPI00299E6B66|nr:recombination regulator RecX [Photobacterium sp.]MDX1304075.1 recombination regulator RecX [Photobacterium sp.]
MRNKTNKQSAQEAAVGYLSRRDHAETELRRKLTTRGFEAQEIDLAISHCQEYGWLNDTRYAAMMVRNGVAKGWGALRIKQEMKMKGVGEDIVNHAIDESDIDWYEHGKEVAQRKFGETVIDSPKEKARRFRFLQYRGFDFDQINYALAATDE